MRNKIMELCNITGLKGKVTIPGDKSISHRCIMFGSIANGTTQIHNFLSGADCLATIRCFRELGIEIEVESDYSSVIVHGKGLHGLSAPEKILDVGCGSGILGMLALKFGAEHSVGTDLDPCAIDATYENMENNGVSRDKYEVMIGNIINDKEVQDKVGYECYDIVAANILAPVLVELTPVIVNQLKPGGIYITSGIIDAKEETVVEAVKEAGLEVLEVTYQGEWVSVTARKN
jgi:ribosomal protein L11 methylase PrmA